MATVEEGFADRDGLSDLLGPRRYRPTYTELRIITEEVVKGNFAAKNGTALRRAASKIVQDVQAGSNDILLGIPADRRAGFKSYVTVERLMDWRKQIGKTAGKRLLFKSNKNVLEGMKRDLQAGHTHDLEKRVSDLEEAVTSENQNDNYKEPGPDGGNFILDINRYSTANERLLMKAVFEMTVHYQNAVSTSAVDAESAIEQVRGGKRKKVSKEAEKTAAYSKKRKEMRRAQTKASNKRAERADFRDKSMFLGMQQSASNAASLATMVSIMASKADVQVPSPVKRAMQANVDLPKPPSPSPVIVLSQSDDGEDEAAEPIVGPVNGQDDAEPSEGN